MLSVYSCPARLGTQLPATSARVRESSNLPRNAGCGAFAKKEISMEKVNIADKFKKITEYWKPYIAGELNGQLVKLDKLKGEFVWHHHEHEDELFLVVKGRFRMELRDRHIWLEEGEFLVVPRGVEHRPVADEEAWIVLFEPATTLNTGNIRNERTLDQLERV